MADRVKMNLFIFVFLINALDFTYHRGITAADDSSTVQDRKRKCITEKQVAFAVMLGEVATLPCRKCDTDVAKSKTRHLWYRFEKQVRPDDESDILWRIVEVEIDMHDEENLNRIIVNEEHELIIKDFQPDDVGTYFCVVTTEKNVTQYSFRSPGSDELTSALAVMEALEKSDPTDQTDQSDQVTARPAIPDDLIDAMIHVDIIVKPFVETVSTDGLSIKLPAKPLVKDSENWMAYTEWASWGPCNACGETMGERKRRGECTVKKIRADDSSSPAVMNRTLRLYPGGAPCHSSLFAGVPGITKRPYEVQIGSCKGKCEKEAVTFNPILDSRINMKEIMMATTQPPPKHVTYKVLVGDRLMLLCPGAKADDIVRWMNTTRIMRATRLQHETDGRVSIDAMNVLRITTAQEHDTGSYSCFVRNRKTADFTINVVEPSKQEDLIDYVMFLGIVFCMNSLVCFGITYLRHRHRQVQRYRPLSEEDAGNAAHLSDGE